MVILLRAYPLHGGYVLKEEGEELSPLFFLGGFPLLGHIWPKDPQFYDIFPVSLWFKPLCREMLSWYFFERFPLLCRICPEGPHISHPLLGSLWFYST